MNKSDIADNAKNTGEQYTSLITSSGQNEGSSKSGNGNNFLIQAPQITLPKGGGAIKA